MDPSTAPQAHHVLPSQESLHHARAKLIGTLPTKGLGLDHVQQHIQHDIVAGLNQPSRSPHFYGFVTGGATEAARFADNVVTANDQNVQVHLPRETVCTDVEDAALKVVCGLLKFEPGDWPHRIFTTGATASNILGLACGREQILRRGGYDTTVSVAEHGIHAAMRAADVEEIQILTTVPHSSLLKAASVVGLGRNSVKDVGRADAPHRFDFQALENALGKPHTASIIAVSCAEVNTGWFATTGAEMQQLRDLCDKHNAWLHVDAAFGLLARALSADARQYSQIREGVAGLELADSITGDAHKLLNVPYDCGIFLSRHLATGLNVFSNTNAAYLTIEGAGAIPSPLNMGIENSRRFRALPVYATLSAYGLDGYRNMLERQIGLARRIAEFIETSEGYELLNGGQGEEGGRYGPIYIVVLFRARDESVNAELVKRINGTRRIYVSGTQWKRKPAARFAIATWQADVERDVAVVQDVLEKALQ